MYDYTVIYRNLAKRGFPWYFYRFTFCTNLTSFYILCTHLNEAAVIKWSEFISLHDQNTSNHDNYHSSTRDRLYLWRIHTTKTLPIDFLYKITAHLTPFSRLWSNWLSQVWYHFEDWDHNSSTNMKKPYDEGYFFEIQSLEEMHALNAYLPISKCF